MYPESLADGRGRYEVCCSAPDVVGTDEPHVASTIDESVGWE